MHISSRRRRVPCAAEQLSSLMHECAGVAGFDRPWSTHRLSSLKLSRWRARRSSRLGRGLTSSALASSESMDSCCRATCDRREGDGCERDRTVPILSASWSQATRVRWSAGHECQSLTVNGHTAPNKILHQSHRLRGTSYPWAAPRAGWWPFSSSSDMFCECSVSVLRPQNNPFCGQCVL